MANRNTNIGGSNWVDGQIMTAEDTNDTFNGMYNEVVSVPAFWLNGSFHNDYGDFNSIAEGSFSGNSNWIVTSGTPVAPPSLFDVIISGTTYTQASGNEMLILAGEGPTNNQAGSITVQTSGLLSDRHTFARIYFIENNIVTNLNEAEFRLGTGSWYSVDKTGNALQNNIFVKALGAGSYDLYLNSYRIETAVGVANPQLTFEVHGRGKGVGNFAGSGIIILNTVLQSVGSVI